MEDVKNDEIDLFDLFKVLFRWKYLILGIVLAGIIMISLIFYKAPVSYSSTGTIKIGKIAGVPVEQFEDLNLFILSLKKNGAELAEIEIDKKLSYINPVSESSTLALKITSSGESYDQSRSIADKTSEIIIERHRKIYTESVKNFKSIGLHSDKSDQKSYFFISSYSYPSAMIGGFDTIQKKGVVKTPVDDIDKKASIRFKDIVKYIVIFIIAFTFCGIMTAFVFDFISSEIKKKKNIN